jgi:hypothetical protein
MMPEVEPPHLHHGHHGARRHLDWILPVCALFVSVVSLILAVIDGRAMGRMADANARLVQANSWPFLQFGASDETPDGRPIEQFEVFNEGVGPAKIQTFEVFWRGRSVRNARELLTACCGLKPGDLPSATDLSGTPEQRAKQMQTMIRDGLTTSSVSRRVIEPRETIIFLRLPPTTKSLSVYNALAGSASDITVRACYCSVFDECWVSSLRTMKPTPVSECPTPKTPYR